MERTSVKSSVSFSNSSKKRRMKKSLVDFSITNVWLSFNFIHTLIHITVTFDNKNLSVAAGRVLCLPLAFNLGSFCVV